jgi:membrane protein required for colicin V production
MTGFDFALIGIILLSTILGAWRGLVYEVLTLIGWPLAFIISNRLYGKVELKLPIDQELVRIIVAYLAIFFVVLLIWGLLIWVLAHLVQMTGLSVFDEFLGSLFGFLRGLLIVLVMVWLAGLTTIPERPFWRNAKFSHKMQEIAMQTKIFLPENIAARIQYSN